MPKRLLHLLCGVFISILFLFIFAVPAPADELDDINKQLADLSDALSKSVAATKPLESQLESLQKQVDQIKQRIGTIDADVAIKKKEIDASYKTLAQKQQILNKTVRDYYMKSYANSPFLIFLSSSSASDLTQTLVYQKITADKDKAIITNIALSITGLEDKEKALKSEQSRLLIAKTSLDEQSTKLDQIVTGAKSYQKEVSGKIAALTAKQQEILNARSGSFTATIGDSDLADDYNASIKGFREAAPAGSFGIFSFGAYTHRKGMSQYGAFGRANAGQDFKTILNAYYGKEPVSKDTGGDISVSGQGSMNFEDHYLLGIAEMPSSFPKEALKAQAIAARTYAYRYKTEGKEICTNEACQVYSASKADNPPDAWRQAVQDTKGQVLEDVVTYYSSTTGGWINEKGWDTTDGQGGSNFSDRAYEKLAGSPWFYKAWWRKGYSSSGDTCGRSSAWLSGEEMADIVNAAIALRTGGIDTSRITPPTTSCWGGNPYSLEELRNLVSGNGGISSASSASVSQGNGSTTNVTINGISFSGDDFKRAFNLRAPGYLSIPQNGFAFFNIEKK